MQTIRMRVWEERDRLMNYIGSEEAEGSLESPPIATEGAETKVSEANEGSGVMSQNIWGGGHNLCEGAKRPSPRERSDRAVGGCGRGGVPPTPHGRELFNFSN